MTVPKHDLRGHVAGRAGRHILIIGVIRRHLKSDAEVRQVEEPTLVEDQILRLQISMDYFLLVACVKANGNACNEKLSYLWLERPLFNHVETQVSTFQKVDDDIEVFVILKCIMNVCYEVFAPIILINHLKKFQFIYNGLDGVLCHNPRF